MNVIWRGTASKYVLLHKAVQFGDLYFLFVLLVDLRHMIFRQLDHHFHLLSLLLYVTYFIFNQDNHRSPLINDSRDRPKLHRKVKYTYKSIQCELEMSRQENRLQHAYSFWHSSRSSGKSSSAQPYDQQLQQITSFDTVEGFWRAYSHMGELTNYTCFEPIREQIMIIDHNLWIVSVRPSDLQGHYDLHLFKSGIKPMWEVSSKFLALSPSILFETHNINTTSSQLIGRSQFQWWKVDR